MGPPLATTVPSLLPLQATSVNTAVTPPTTMALINRAAWFTTSIVCPRCAASNRRCGLKVVGDKVAGLLPYHIFAQSPCGGHPVAVAIQGRRVSGVAPMDG